MHGIELKRISAIRALIGLMGVCHGFDYWTREALRLELIELLEE